MGLDLIVCSTFSHIYIYLHDTLDKVFCALWPRRSSKTLLPQQNSGTVASFFAARVLVSYPTVSVSLLRRGSALPPRRVIRNQLDQKTRKGPRKMVQHCPKLFELTRFCSMNLKKIYSTLCQAYHKDEYGVLEARKRNAMAGPMIIQNFREGHFSKEIEILRNMEISKGVVREK